MTAEQQLTMALLKLASEGRRPVCGDWRENNPWLDEDHRLREMAARWCQGCELLDLCGASADERQETFGVWGGVDRGHRGRAER